MATIHNTSMNPGKLDLLARWLPRQSWYGGSGDLTRAGGFRLDDPAGEVGIEFMVVLAGPGEPYLVPMTYRGEQLNGADKALIGTSEHGVLGTRWIYDGEHDPVLRAQLAALLRGEVTAQAQSVSDTPDATVLVRSTQTPSEVRIERRLDDSETQPGSGGHVSGTWRRPDGSEARGIFAVAR
jgi:hypothetical protein